MKPRTHRKLYCLNGAAILSVVTLLIFINRSAEEPDVKKDKEQPTIGITNRDQQKENLFNGAEIAPVPANETEPPEEPEMVPHTEIVKERIRPRVQYWDPNLSAVAEEPLAPPDQGRLRYESFSKLQENPSTTPGTPEHQALVREILFKRGQRLK